jgi:hypothetical protein
MAFPLTAPYRIDQVTQAPLLMAALFALEVLLALLIQWAALRGHRRLLWGAAAGLLGLVLVFFTLASWGNSDTTRFSHALQWDPERAPPEPLWRLLAPLLLLLPYRMAALHGLVATGFAAAAMLLARAWGAPAWAGWWSLLITASPLLRGFLQNAHSRQALATLLLLPLLLRCSGLLRLPARWLGGGVLLSALSHNTVVWNLPLALLPLLVRLRRLPALLASPRRAWLLLLALVGAVLLLALVAPVALQRFHDYSQDAYFNRYPLRSVVGRLQRALALGLVLACVQRRLDPRQLLRCELTQQLLLFGLLYAGLQLSIAELWLPQITSRLADGVGFFLLILYLGWLARYRAHWCLLPALYVTLQYWLENRILASGALSCGLNDDFLCLPDRWPWQVRW